MFSSAGPDIISVEVNDGANKVIPHNNLPNLFPICSWLPKQQTYRFQTHLNTYTVVKEVLSKLYHLQLKKINTFLPLMLYLREF